MTPLEVGPRIRSHPTMMVTARNKMGSARVVSQNYSGCLLQTTTFRLSDRLWLEVNLDATEGLLGDLGDPTGSSRASQPFWSDVPWHTVDQFISRYLFDPRGAIESRAVRQYIQAQVQQQELVEWFVSIRGRNTLDTDLGSETRLSPAGLPINRISRTRLRGAPHSIGSLVNPATLRGTPGSGDEEVDLTDKQLHEARVQASAIGSFPRALRRQRSPRQGLLLLYPISPYSRPRPDDSDRQALFDEPERNGCTVVGLGIVFPESESAATIEYVVGSVAGDDAG